MPELDSIEKEFVEIIKKFFPPEQNNRIGLSHSGLWDITANLTVGVSVDVKTAGDDLLALLKEIDGNIARENKRIVAIYGRFQGRSFHVTITHTGADTSAES